MRAWEFLPRPTTAERVGERSTGTALGRPLFRCPGGTTEPGPDNTARPAPRPAGRVAKPEHRRGRR